MKAHAVVTAGALAMLLSGAAAEAMTMDVRGDQLVASGRIVPDDAARFRSLVAANPDLKTVVLWNSPGGSAAANDAMTEIIESRGLNTVVTGFCVSACAMVFLAGKDRSFGDLEPLRLTSLGFHASYVDGHLAADRRLAALKARVLERTGGKIDPALVDRWLHIDDERSSIRFQYPGEPAAGTTTYFCPRGRFPNAGDYKPCDAIPNTSALSAGIVTSTQIVHVNR
ncbi:MAG: hypothetical protein QOF71_1085, partial [Candidatus Eremiobacteraeota bacterium]|nr:hypothetical protein [Candidatus Eremiobacteraeota bacterium]